MEDRILFLGQLGGTLFTGTWSAVLWTDIETYAKLAALFITMFAGIVTGLTGIYAIKRHKREIQRMDDEDSVKQKG